MRLSAHVYQHGIDAFNFEDFLFVGKQVSKAPEPLIIVGGQALETWGLFFDVLAPTGDRHPLTEDTDFLGSKQDAMWLCQRLGQDVTELQMAPPDDTGPSTALAYIKRPDGRVLMMDFLRTIVGPSNEVVRKLAVPVRIADSVTVHVLHPLLCLESRMANLQVLPSKRQGNGPMQAQWAVSIATAFLQRTADSVLDESAQDELAKACRSMSELAEYKYGRYCWLEYRLDPLVAVTHGIAEKAGARFATDEWPRHLERIDRKRKKWQHIHSVRQARHTSTA